MELNSIKLSVLQMGTDGEQLSSFPTFLLHEMFHCNYLHHKAFIF